ncbi:MAG TPA: hypothetical protein VFU55_14060 [Terracidiphilus sp.]|nr:hypothetical protein [Terracidiphilus sp.]
MSSRVSTINPVVLSYHEQRRAVGILALSLPFLLAGGRVVLALLGPGHRLPKPILEHSISDYYYSSMGNVLVGSLCAIAVFLICSRGYDPADEVAGYVAGVGSLGVALVPSLNPGGGPYTRMQIETGHLHSAFAGLMFLALAYFCLVLFRRTSPLRKVTRRKLHRNRIYLACGLVILACDAGMAALAFPAVALRFWNDRALLLCETLALMAFGIAWLTKGNGILKDQPKRDAPANGEN